jgi:hypothetical protein
MGTIIAVIEGVWIGHYGIWFMYLGYVFDLGFCFCLCFLERNGIRMWGYEKMV